MIVLRPDQKYRLYELLFVLDVLCIGLICGLLLHVAFSAG